MGVEQDNEKSSERIKRLRDERHGERGWKRERHTKRVKGRDREREGERE